MTPHQINTLVAIFLASMLATTVTSLFLNWATTGLNDLDWLGRLLLSVAGTIILGAIVGGVFYLFLPSEARRSKN